MEGHSISTDGFAEFSQRIELKAGQAQTINLTLKVVITDQIEVTTEAAGVSTEPDQIGSRWKNAAERRKAPAGDENFWRLFSQEI